MRGYDREEAGRQVVRVLRVIGRMNLGGPAYHVALLSGRLDRARFETLLVSGRAGPGEEDFREPAERYGARIQTLPSLGPRIRPLSDLRALAALVRLTRTFRPHIVHTHTSKAGIVGRAAALLAGRRRPVVVHTYHGHVLEGYFGPARTLVYRVLERLLARVTDRLICVSEANVDDLVRLGVAPRPKFEVVPLGLELEDFRAADPAAARAFREEIGAGVDEVVVTYVGRLVPVKRVDLLLRGVARAQAAGAPIRLVIVGDGELRPQLERLARQVGLDGRVRFLGYRTDVAPITAGSDIAVVTSDQEGTPVSLIQAAAAGLPLVATRVGGVADVVSEGGGLLVPPRDEQGVADALAELAEDAELRERMGAVAQAHVVSRFSSGRLVERIERLYEALLESRQDPSP